MARKNVNYDIMKKFLILTACGLWAMFCFASCSGESSSAEDAEEKSSQTPGGMLFFRDDDTGNLKYVAFDGRLEDVAASLIDSVPVEMDLNLDCYHPEVSPDGKWVAFSTTHENSGAYTELYVKEIGTNALPLKLPVQMAAIPRWHVNSKGDTSIVYVDNTGLNQKDLWFSYGTWIVPFMKGAFGTPKKLFNGAFNGGFSKDLTFFVNSSALLMGRYVTYSGDSIVSMADSIWYDGEQTCNASLSKDGTNRTLFLDMAGKQGLEFVGESFRPHQRILVIDSLGHLISAVPSEPNTAFDHTEWVGYKDYAVASLQNANLLHTKIVLVNIADSSIVDLVSGGELWHPNLWIKSDKK